MLVYVEQQSALRLFENYMSSPSILPSHHLLRVLALLHSHLISQTEYTALCAQSKRPFLQHRTIPKPFDPGCTMYLFLVRFT